MHADFLVITILHVKAEFKVVAYLHGSQRSDDRQKSQVVNSNENMLNAPPSPRRCSSATLPISCLWPFRARST